jgi:hypothetical protein
MGLLLVLGSGAALQAQPTGAGARPDSSAQQGPWVPPPAEVWRDAVEVARGPFTLSPRERGWTLGAAGLVVGAAAILDVPAYDHLSTRSADGVSARARSLTNSVAGPGEWYDDRNANRLTLGLIGGVATGGVLLRDRRVTRTSVELLEAIVYTEGVNGLLKSALNRARPYVGDEPDPAAFDLGAFRGDHEDLAMPSGHAARTFVIASVFSERADRWYVSVPLYAGATSVGIERVRSGDHWLTDVMVGAAVGTLIGRSVVDDRSDSPSKTAGDRVQYRPVLSLGRVGMRVQF